MKLTNYDVWKLTSPYESRQSAHEQTIFEKVQNMPLVEKLKEVQKNLASCDEALLPQLEELLTEILFRRSL